MNNKESFKKELAVLINQHSLENESNTPDFILADYLVKCLETYNHIIFGREVKQQCDEMMGNASTFAERLKTKQEVKPTLGVIPKKFWKEQRYLELWRAISDRYKSHQEVRLEWVEELNELTMGIEK